MATRDLVDYWTNGATEALKVAEDLFRLQHYQFCLFFCHLTAEKSIKAYLTKHKQSLPPIHNLTTLLRGSKLGVPSEWLENLEEMNSFNVKTRYNDIKRDLYHKATPLYTQKFLKFSKEFFLWIKSQF